MLKKMLFPTDLSEVNLKILEYAGDMKKAGVEEVKVLYVINTSKLGDVSGGIDIDNYIEEESRKAEEGLKKVTELLKEINLKVELVQPFPTGEPVNEIIHHSKDCDFIVMNSRGASTFKKILLGSVSEGVLKMSHKPVYIFKFNEDTAKTPLFDKILVPYDFSEHSKIALEYAKYIAIKVGSEIHLLHVMEEEYGEDLEKLADGLREEGIKASAHLHSGVPHKVILRKQEELNATTIFMGSRGLGTVRSLLLGSTSDSVIRRSKVPVFVFKAPSER